jgi:hypothetical protein
LKLSSKGNLIEAGEVGEGCDLIAQYRSVYQRRLDQAREEQITNDEEVKVETSEGPFAALGALMLCNQILDCFYYLVNSREAIRRST